MAAGHKAWPTFDREVFGGNYRGHFRGEVPGSRGTKITIEKQQNSSPILQGVSADDVLTPSWLYKMSPLEPGTTVLSSGRRGGPQEEPVAWTLRTSGGGRAFYTSLGHPDEFQTPWFRTC